MNAAMGWLIRTYTPAWLELAGLDDEARHLRELRLDDPAEHKGVAEVAREVRHATEQHAAATTARVDLPADANVYVGTAVEAAIDATAVADVVVAAWRSVELRDSWAWDAWEYASDAVYAAAWAVAWAGAAGSTDVHRSAVAALADIVEQLRDSAAELVAPADLAVTA